MTRRLTSLFLLLTIASVTVLSQNKISGTITDASSKECIEFANISLLSLDSAFVKGTTTDDKGSFRFEGVNSGDYLVCAAYTGYNKSYTRLDNLRKDIDLGEIPFYTSDIALNEVTVTGNSVIYKADRQIIMPNEAQIKASNNGIKLLENLQLPRIEIDPLTKAVSMTGQREVQLRINGIQVTKEDVMSIAPADIIRIEYHDDPGMRYGDAGAVINFITRVRESGGNIMLNINEGATLDWAQDNFSARVNHKKSEFSIDGFWYRRNIEWTRENIETFNFPAAPQLVRTEKGMPTKYKENNFHFSMNYALHDTDNYLFNVRFRNRNDHTPNAFDDRESTIYSSDGSNPLDIVNHSTWKSYSPSLDLYFQKHLKNDQLLIFNVVGTYIDSKSTRLYTERQNSNLLTDIFSDIWGDKYSLIAEGIYEKGFESSKLSAGMKHTQSYTNNQYQGNVVSDVSMNNAETYAFAEYQLKKGKFNYALGLGIMRTYNSQGGDNNEKYIFRPKVRISYNPNDNIYFRYTAETSGYAPSLSDLNNVEQAMDSLQIQRGNPNLKTVVYYNTGLTFGFNKGIFSGEIQTAYNYDRKPIMEQISFESGKFIHSKANQKGFHRISVFTHLNVKIWGDYLVLTVSPAFRRYISEGNDYSHNYNMWRVNGYLNFNYKGWMANAGLYARWNDFWGETLSRGERGHSIGAGYNAKKWSLSCFTFIPFSKHYFQENINRSALAPKYSKVYTNDMGQGKMIAVNFTLNVNFGRQFNSANKRLNNDDSDAGIMK
ncbi:carboxypeptidase regulatory-like domain-containing protein [Dysgonomonas sp. 25]|uniref:carboxypeptidase regulatory-like domain-containing protein n=1 Tax=Dysgonomonas sp. 25 TaxID=2302933 RepID=UPI0013D636FB|nr:carboxypeptidase regulatory-like domain-containing protein [Dysgonomonas sp. 25]NDV67843.1 TonB-dependent receptor [Dysgonomonas sp. 25]